MAAHQFAVGESVSVFLLTRSLGHEADTFTVKAQMPHVGTQLQYRVKSESEPFDRVVTEEQMTKAEAPLPPAILDVDRRAASLPS